MSGLQRQDGGGSADQGYQQALQHQIEQASLDQASLDQASLDQASLDQASLDQASLDQASLDQASLDHSAVAPELQHTDYGSGADPLSYAQSASHHLHTELPAQRPVYDLQDAALYNSVNTHDATISGTNWTATPLSTINWLQSDIMTFSDDDLNNLFAFFSGDFAVSPSIDFVSPFQQHDVDSPATDLFPNVIDQQKAVQLPDDNSSYQQNLPVSDAFSVPEASTVASGEYYVDGDAGRLHRAKRRKIVSRPGRLNRCEHREFSLEYRRPVIICSEPRLIVSDRLYDQLRTLHRKLCLETMTFKAFVTSDFPTKPAIEGLLFNYLAHFDQTMPFFHLPTFSMDSSHCALLLTMMALGSSYIDSEDTETFTLSMHEFVRRYLMVGSEQEDWPQENSQTLAQVHLLHAIGAGFTEVSALHASASRSMSQATKFCRDAWALRGVAAAPGSQHDDETANWMTWIKKEELIRTGFCIWLLDCTWAFHFQQPPHLRLDHATAMPLPCPERLWAANNVPAWKYLTASGAPGPTRTPTLLEALRNLYVDKRLLPNLGEFSRILLIHGLFHRTWEVSATVTQSLSNFEPSAQQQASCDLELGGPIWPPSVPLFNRWRNSACDCLDILHWGANETIGAACGIEHPTVLHLHLARVILLGPMRDLVPFAHHLIRSSKDAIHLFPSVSSADAEVHRRLIQRWALQDQHKARLAAIHAGVLLWHVRLYSINAFYEPTAVAFATLLLWALGAFSTKPSAAASQDGARAGRSAGAGQSAAAGPAAPAAPSPDMCDIILIDRPTDDELVQQFVRQGDGMHVNLTGVGNLFGPAGPRRVLAEGQKLLGTLRSWPGLTGYWIGVLGRLEQVTAMFGEDAGATSNAAGGAVTTTE